MAADRLRLLSRPGCHLCEEMAGALRDLHLQFDIVNVEGDPALEEKYGEAVPVLMRGEQEVMRAPHTRRSLKRALQRSGVI
jgi:glutaredoxin